MVLVVLLCALPSTAARPEPWSKNFGQTMSPVLTVKISRTSEFSDIDTSLSVGIRGFTAGFVRRWSSFGAKSEMAKCRPIPSTRYMASISSEPVDL
ncbi:hypothetical protein C8R46DRAFT_1096682, partial [Mycena filopes]